MVLLDARHAEHASSMTLGIASSSMLYMCASTLLYVCPYTLTLGMPRRSPRLRTHIY
jgi:hypothetical protein